MISYVDYVNKNIDRLEEEYKEYREELEANDIDIPDNFDDFCNNAYESACDDYADECYERYKEKDI